MLQQEGVDEIQDLMYDAGAIRKSALKGPGGYQKQRLMSQQFDQIIDSDQLNPLQQHFYQTHFALSKRDSVANKWKRRLSSTIGSISETSLNNPHVLRQVSLPEEFESGSDLRRSSCSSTTDTYAMPRLPTNDLRKDMFEKQVIARLSDEKKDKQREEEVNFSSEATMGVESVSKNTPQAVVLQEMIAKSRAASISTHRADEGRRRSSTVLGTLAEPVKKNSSEKIVGRFRVQSTVTEDPINNANSSGNKA